CRVTDLFLPKLPAVHNRHHQIEKNHARANTGTQPLECTFSVLGGLNRIPFELQKSPEHFPRVQCVLDNQYCGAHALLLRFASWIVSATTSASASGMHGFWRIRL